MKESQTKTTKISYTSEQMEAMTYTDSNLLVSASAGSGKTAVLVERIIYILETEENVSLKNMAIMTFTKAAAAQMKERLRNRVMKKIDEKAEVEKWQKVLYEIPTAYITTIDSFCNSIVRDNFYKLGIDLSYTVMDTVDEQMLENEVWNDIYRMEYEKDKEGKKGSETASFEELSDYFDTGFSFDGLKEAVFAISHFCDSEPWPDEFLDDVEASYSGESESILVKSYAKENNLSYEEAFCELNERADFGTLSPIVIRLLSVVRSFRDRMSKIKKAKGQLSFADLEHFALQILVNREDRCSNKSEVGVSYEKNFAYILVDEYQDSNYLQEEIINSISNGRNVFMVGDLKQSIYGFRQAKCEIFQNKLQGFQSGSDGKVVFLSKNFRSDKRILDFVNRVCQYAMDGINYSMKYEKEQLLQSGLNKVSGKDEFAVTMLMVAEGYTYDKNESMDKHDAAAMVIGRKIKELIRDKTIIVSESGEKELSYGEVAILMRAKSGRISSYIRALESLGIPYELDSANSFLDGLEVRVLIDYFRLIDNSCQDIPTASVMLSGIGRFCEEELVKIRLCGDSGESFYKVVKQYAEFSSIPKDKLWDELPKEKHDYYDKDLSKRVAEFLDKIKIFKSYSYVLPFYDFVQKVIKDSGIKIYAANLVHADKRLEDIRQLENLVLEFSQGENYGLSDFLYYIEKLYENGCSLDRRNKVTGNQDAVKIMTVHGSKGLEMPVIFYSGLNGRFNIKSESLTLNSNAGLGLPVIDLEQRVKKHSYVKSFIEELNKKQQVEEEIRLMYVALTRAMSKLFLVMEGDFFGKMEKTLGTIYPNYFDKLSSSAANTIGDYILPVLCEKNPDFFLNVLHKIKPEKLEKDISNEGAEVLKSLMNQDEKGMSYTSDMDDIHMELCGNLSQYEDFDLLLEEEEAGKNKIEWDFEKMGEEILGNLQFQYENMDIDKPVKLSVTKYSQIVREEGEGAKSVEDTYLDGELGGDTLDRGWQERKSSEKENKWKLSFKKEKERGTAAGTLYHKILELWDFKGTYHSLSDVERYVSSLIERGIVKEDTLDIIDLRLLLAFVRSDLYQRMKKADEAKLLFRERNFLYQMQAKEIYQHGGSQEIMIEGIVDAYFLEDEKLVLVDYKSDRSREPEYYIEHYTTPMNLYSGALGKAYDREVKEKIIYSLRMGEIVL